MYAPEIEFVCDGCEKVAHLKEQVKVEYMLGHEEITMYLCSACFDAYLVYRMANPLDGENQW